MTEKTNIPSPETETLSQGGPQPPSYQIPANKANSMRPLLILLVLVFAIGTVSFLVFAYRQSWISDNNSFLTTLKPSGDAYLMQTNNQDQFASADPFSIPELNSQFSWKKVTEFDDSNSINLLYVSNSKTDILLDPLRLSGEMWQAQQPIQTGQELETTLSDFQTELDQKYEEYGWQQKLEMNDIHFETVAADGPRGSVWGYIKSSGNFIRVVNVSYTIESELLDDCPCSLTIEYFRSQPLSVLELAKSLQ